MRKGIREMVASTLFGALDHQLAIKKEAAFRKRSKEDQAKILNEVSPGLCLAQPCAQPHPNPTPTPPQNCTLGAGPDPPSAHAP